VMLTTAVRSFRRATSKTGQLHVAALVTAAAAISGAWWWW